MRCNGEQFIIYVTKPMYSMIADEEFDEYLKEEVTKRALGLFLVQGRAEESMLEGHAGGPKRSRVENRRRG